MITDNQTIYLVDDDDSVRRSLTRLLKSLNLKCLAFSSATEFLTQHHDQMRGCIILDLQMPELTGLNVQTALNERKSSLPIIFLTGKGDIPTTVSAMKAGASDFLTKPASEATLLGAINRALETDRQAHAQRVELAKLRALFARLTPRETEVLRYVVQGYLNKQTAAELGTVEKTIKVHRARLMDKLEVESLAELVRMVEHAGVFENHQ